MSLLLLVVGCMTHTAPLALAGSVDPLPEYWVRTGPVEVRRCQVVTPWFSTNESYTMGEMVAEAKSKAQADNIISVRVDVESTSTLWRSDVCYVLRGMAVRYATQDELQELRAPTPGLPGDETTETGPAPAPTCGCEDLLADCQESATGPDDLLACVEQVRLCEADCE